MKNFNPIRSPAGVNVIYAEDSEEQAKLIKTGLQKLVGIPLTNISHFLELDKAAEHIKQIDRQQPTIAIFDNSTPSSTLKGHELALSLLGRQDEFPNLLVVTVSSSDMGLVYDNGGEVINNIHKLGGEFWAKNADGYLMLLWLGECMRTAVMTTREDWLTRMGIETRYRTTREQRLPQDKAIFSLLSYLAYYGDIENTVLSDAELEKDNPFFSMQPETVMEKLGFPPQGALELAHPTSKR